MNSYTEQLCSKCGNLMDQYRQGKVKVCSNCKHSNQLEYQRKKSKIKSGNNAWKKLANNNK